MSNPVFVDCPAGVWTKIATSVVTGLVHKIIHTRRYLQTYKETGEAAPTQLNEGVSLFLNDSTELISANTPIDVYVWCLGDAGRVRVDL